MIAFALLAPLAGLAEPAYRKPLAPLGPWVALVDDSATADSAYAGVLAVMPSLRDSFPRGFAWYLLYSAAQAKGRIDSMHVAAESSFALLPSDPTALREFGMWLGRRRQRLELAEDLMRRTVSIVERDPAQGSLVADLAWLGEIQSRRGRDDAAITTWERCAAEARGTYPYVLFTLADAYARRGEVDRAVGNLVAGLSLFTRDTANAAEARGKLDSLAAVRGLSRDSLHAAIDRALSASREHFYLGAYRQDRRAPARRMVDFASGQARPVAAGHELTVLYFWTTWCAPCRASLPLLEEWAERPRTPPVRVLTVNGDDDAPAVVRDRVGGFIRDRGLTLPVLLADTTAIRSWQVGSYPTTFVVRDGRIVYRGHAGELVEGLEAQLQSLGSRRVE